MRVCWFIFLCAASSAQAASWFVSTAGSDANPGSRALPFATLTRGVTAMAAGDELVLLPGTWVGQQLSNPPSGTLASPTRIRADLPGTTIIDANQGLGLPYPGAALDIDATHQFIEVTGITLKNGDESVANLLGSHLTLREVSASTCNDQKPYCSIIEADGADLLLEDVWVFGSGRELISIFGDRTVLRRVVARYERYANGSNTASLISNQALDVSLQNVLILDCAPPPDPSQAYAAIFSHATADRLAVTGSIILNCAGFQTAIQVADSPFSGTVSDSVVWGASSALNLGSGGSATNVTVGNAAKSPIPAPTAPSATHAS